MPRSRKDRHSVNPLCTSCVDHRDSQGAAQPDVAQPSHGLAAVPEESGTVAPSGTSSSHGVTECFCGCGVLIDVSDVPPQRPGTLVQHSTLRKSFVSVRCISCKETCFFAATSCPRLGAGFVKKSCGWNCAACSNAEKVPDVVEVVAVDSCIGTGRSGLPILAARGEIQASLSQNRVTLVDSPMASGKTSRVPILSDEVERGRTLTLVPSAIAAQGAATAMAVAGFNWDEITVRCGGIDAEKGGPWYARFSFVTRGTFFQWLITFGLHEAVSRYTTILIDDPAHDALTLSILRGLRDCMPHCRTRIVVMSATMNSDFYTKMFEGFSLQTVHVTERRYTLYRFMACCPDGLESAYAAKIVANRWNPQATAGILVFLPGHSEITLFFDILHQILEHSDHRRENVSLDADAGHYGETPIFRITANTDNDVQRRAATKVGNKIVASTETFGISITVRSVRLVVNSCMVKRPKICQKTGTTSLVTVLQSESGAAQAGGRAGREEDGEVIYLKDPSTLPKSDASDTPDDVAKTLVLLEKVHHETSPTESLLRDGVAPSAVLRAQLRHNCLVQSNLGEELVSCPCSLSAALLMHQAKKESVCAAMATIASCLEHNIGAPALLGTFPHGKPRREQVEWAAENEINVNHLAEYKKARVTYAALRDHFGMFSDSAVYQPSNTELLKVCAIIATYQPQRVAYSHASHTFISGEPASLTLPTGYLLYADEVRTEVKAKLESELGDDEKLKPQDVVTAIAARWEGAEQEVRDEWNTKASTQAWIVLGVKSSFRKDRLTAQTVLPLPRYCYWASRKRISLFGDSTTDGFISIVSEWFLKMGWLVVHNRSLPGAGAEGIEREIREAAGIAQVPVDVLLVLLNGNDIVRGTMRRTCCQTLVDTCLSRSKRAAFLVGCGSLYPQLGAEYAEHTKVLRSMLCDAGADVVLNGLERSLDWQETLKDLQLKDKQHYKESEGLRLAQGLEALARHTCVTVAPRC